MEFVYKCAKGALRIIEKILFSHPYFWPLIALVLRPQAKILFYHRLSEGDVEGSLAPSIFEKQVRELTRYFKVLNVSQLIQQAKGKTARNLVAISFDDGYADVYQHAFPILRKYGLTGTVYVVTRFIDQDIWLWPDVVRYAIFNTQAKEIEVPGLGTFRLTERREKREAWRQICNHCMTVDAGTKIEIINQLCQTLQVELPARPPEQYRGMNWDEVREMHQAGIEIGSHTCTHPILSRLTPSNMGHEVCFSKEYLERQLRSDVRSFCYPNGQASDFNEQTKNFARQAGYENAVVAHPHARPDDCFEFPRYSVGASMVEFRKIISGYNEFINAVGIGLRRS